MENNTQLLMGQVMHLYVQRSIQLLKKLNVHPGQSGMLWTLCHNDGVSQKELAKKLGITPPSITVMLRKLETEEMIFKKQDEKDQRITRIYITEKGRKVAEQMGEVLAQIEAEVFAEMSQEEVLLLRRLFLQMKKNLTKKGENVVEKTV